MLILKYMLNLENNFIIMYLVIQNNSRNSLKAIMKYEICNYLFPLLKFI